MLTVRDAARRTGRNAETVRRWIWDGKLPARKIGNQLFVEEADLARFAGASRERRRAEALALTARLRELHRSIRARGAPVVSGAELIEQMRAGESVDERDRDG